MQILRLSSCSNIAPIPTSDASAARMVVLFGANGTSIGLSAMSLIKLRKVLSHWSAHRNSSDNWADNSVYALFCKIEDESRMILQTSDKRS